MPVSPFKKLPPNTSMAPPPVGGRRVLPPITRVDSLPEEVGPLVLRGGGGGEGRFVESSCIRSYHNVLFCV